MQLPNKITTYEESIISKFLPVLRIIEKNDSHILSLYYAVKSEVDGVDNFLMVLDCLYALGKINFNDEGRMVCYVGDVD